MTQPAGLASAASVLDAAQNGLVVVPEPERDTLWVRGSDGKSWLNGIVSSDLGPLAPGRGAYGLLLNKVGKIQTDLDVLTTSSALLLGVAQGLGEAIRATLDRYLIMEDAELENGADFAWLRLHGPRASAVAAELGRDARVVAFGVIDWLGIGGAGLVTQRGDLSLIAQEAVTRAGPGSRLATGSEWDALRIRYGFPLFGVDYGTDDNPHEASLERRAVSFTKGCYLGQEVVCMQDMRGRVKRRLVPLRVAPVAGPSLDSAEVTAPGIAEAVGRVTSAGAAGDERFAFARIKAPFFEGETALSIGGAPAEFVGQDAPR